ncbi:DNA cytosine methyltransferase [Janthinobacterium agaricidamnosum]|uniref:DNA (cytosine-5-)-methyltransferase n=1 Tax=Janthinobacterium agaricidamnosum NBRC 102515 = DSM 9628 TaxID=1349767 RepID=W0VAF7_9BURK|nr:DNA cytosine methyltransferase [Janthinobacterium agaricidamnosum]CDG84866.1 DNA-cytosine methyltransferase family protein [Janthinobacterium agaricidamnosum NBRC 102515 = DSM 9628]
MAERSKIPVIDLFAGPGGLCEGFSSIVDENGLPRFGVKVSIEKDPVAHRTLMLRALFRKFPKGHAPDSYYQYVRGDITREEFFKHPDIKSAEEEAAKEARCAELGATPHETIDAWIREGIGSNTNWVLIGGPPCQAYSTAGRSRLRGKDPEAFESDKRHFLYTEYLRIIQEFEPSVFVMENVKGMLSSKHGGSKIFERILRDLSAPKDGLSYQIRSLVVEGNELKPSDYVIEADDYGVPQSRHRVILFGIRSDVAESTPALAQTTRRFLLRKTTPKVGVTVALSGLPSLRSRLSKEPDSHQAWHGVMKKARSSLNLWRSPLRGRIEALMLKTAAKAEKLVSSGGSFIPTKVTPSTEMPKELRSWYLDNRLGGVLQHETRSHMRSDLHRYLFAACFAQEMGYAPTLYDFPPKLMPDHMNVDAEEIPFADRFRVQIGNAPSSTVVAHIKKDGHYYIHPDPVQCRSLTVREAARLQTFPDNYFFEGSRTEQYGQIGNAVPPLLARKIAKVVYKFLASLQETQ